MNEFYATFVTVLTIITAIFAACATVMLALFLMVLGWMIVEHAAKKLWNYSFGTNYRSPFDQ